MSDPRRYDTHGSGAGGNYIRSKYSSLENAVSYPITNQSNPSAAQYPGSMAVAQGYPTIPSSHGRPSSHSSSQSSYGPPYGMTAPPISPDSPLGNYGFNTGAQYPNDPNPAWQSAQASAAGWTGVPPPYAASNPYPTSQPAPAPAAAGMKQCHHCHTTTTPLWRRDPATHATLCNACGIYQQQRRAPRPRELIEADDAAEPGDDEGGGGGGAGPECSNCHTRQTSVWRRNHEGAQVCNACGVYQRLRGTERPLSLKRNKVKPRAKQPQN
ncbi:hypothetical protein B0H15DRAFT_952698 [Mycena belliarum]|uniref:GATA-type domain-containing protein n=1 Tax=Mycena belliarum TaxID=1033014 RepID=A0AAD6XND3_9AGAR|nr:hypothetical protein B0H15DRAFT_952698 [Mycena belliae]